MSKLCNYYGFIRTLNLIFNSKALYLLGAGVSSFYVPPKYNLYAQAKKLMEELVVGPIIKNNSSLSEEDRIRFEIQGCKHVFHITETGKTLIDDSQIDLYDQILFSNPFILEIFCALAYSIESFTGPCPEYQIFNHINQGSVIANLNHDNLADNFICNRIPVIPLHGTISDGLIRFLKDNIDYIIENGYTPTAMKDLYLSTQENINLLSYRQNYIDFMNILNSSKFLNIVVIGYSFFKKNSTNIYDVVTYDRIRDYLIQNRKCNLVVIDIEPNFVADVFSKDTFHHAGCYPLNWSAFCYAMYYISNKNLSNVFKLNPVEYASASKLYCCWVNSFNKQRDDPTSLFSRSQEILVLPHYLRSNKNFIIDRF